MKIKKNKNVNYGAGILLIMFLLAFTIVGVRMLYIQVTGKVDGRVLATMAEEKYTSKRTIPAQRGVILDRNGNILAKDTRSYDIIAVLDSEMTTNKKEPLHVVNPKQTAKKLAPLLNMKVQEVERILMKDKKQVEFGANGRNLNTDTKNKIEKLKLPGIAFKTSTKRTYPNGDFASHVIGLTKTENEDNEIGISGVEKSEDRYLLKDEGSVTQQQSRYGFLLPGKKAKINPPRNGEVIELTIDGKIQYYLESAVEKVNKKNKPKKMMAVVSDPATGQILAMTSRPSFDPNLKNITYFNNDVVSYAFEPGSTMKIFTVASAIEEGVYKDTDTFQSGSYKIGNDPIRDHNDGNGWGRITFEEGVQRSSNVAMALLTNKMGEDTFYKYLQKFGLDKKTNIDLPNEVGSRINYRAKRDQISTSFGQASAFTPIQQVQGVSAIANKGKMMQPYVVKRVFDSSSGKVIMNKNPRIVGEPISEKTATKTLSLLESVVSSKHGTGKIFKLDHYKIAGKTGTAQIFEDGEYISGSGNNIYSFMGLAPASDPKLIIYVAIQQPSLVNGETGASLLAEIIKPTMEQSLKHLSVKPDKQRNLAEVKDDITIQSFIGDSITDVSDNSLLEGMKTLVLGEGDEIIKQSPSAGSKALLSETIIFKTNGEVKMPDIRGWSLRDVSRLALLLNMEIDYSGKGYVVSQNIKPGSKVDQSDKLYVKLAVSGS
ncbi:penicillin-binding transpeptidase domain-containing protein [Bacillus sp. JJ722]|uniref:penicillin-binding transpeptidase domain-containing protein n=1 Tax=Bacillus sp. JJ722 TaxID=3122973 RepID=UPI002FFD72C3